MTLSDDVAEWLDDHQPSLVDQSMGEVAEDVIDDLGKGSRETVRRYVGRWKHGEIGETYATLNDMADDEGPDEAETPLEQPPDEPVGLTVPEDDKVYREDGDYYDVWLPSRGGRVEVDGEAARQMKRAYTNEVGRGKTIKEVAQSFGWDENAFRELKQVLGWVHNDTRYTDEEHLEEGPAGKKPPEMVRSTLAAKKQEYIVERNQAIWKETKADAKKYRDLKAGKLDPIADHVVDHPPAGDVPRIEAEPRDYMAVFSPADLHLGKLGVDGYDIEAAQRLVRTTTRRILERMTRYGRPERIVVVLGNDWFHVDNPQGATTNGTPQDVDGLPEDVIGAGYDLAVEVIDMIRQFGPVEIWVVPSNHGEWSDYHTMHGLRLGYRHVDDVEVECNTSPRQYLHYGKNLIGLEHGDGAKDTDLPMIMAKKRPELWGETEWRYWLTGHLHHLKEQDRGVVIMQAPSLSGDDRWHDKKGYVLSDRGQVAYLFERERGHTDRMLAMVG